MSNLGPLAMFRPHPLLGWSLSPNAHRDVRFRSGVRENVGSDGWRVVAGAPAEARTTIGFYGCSFTFGSGLADNETFPSLLQSRLPGVRVVNRGVGGHSTVHSYLQFRKDARQGAVNAAVICVISDHRYRNYGHPVWMRRHLIMDWYKVGIEHIPRARIDRSGNIWIEFLPIWQQSLLREDFDFIFPDEYTLDTLTIRVLQEIKSISSANNIPVVFALLDSVDADFFRILGEAIPEFIDVSTPYDPEHTFLPEDIHPNVQANKLFAERLYPSVSGLLL
jgi:lysophospholipase L1-like esterase